MNKNIRISNHKLQMILDLFHESFLKDDSLWIFSSRTNLSKKGGDIDFYVETNADSIEEAINMKYKFLSNL